MNLLISQTKADAERFKADAGLGDNWHTRGIGGPLVGRRFGMIYIHGVCLSSPEEARKTAAWLDQVLKTKLKGKI